MNTNRKKHITLTVIGFVLSLALTAIGMFVLPRFLKAGSIPFDVITWGFGIALLVATSVYAKITLTSNTDKKEVGLNVTKTLIYIFLILGALALIVGGIFYTRVIFAAGAVMKILGTLILGVTADIIAESNTERSARGKIRAISAIITLFAMVIIFFI